MLLCFAGRGLHGEDCYMGNCKELPCLGQPCLSSPGHLTEVEPDRRIFPSSLRMLPAQGTLVGKYPGNEGWQWGWGTRFCG